MVRNPKLIVLIHIMCVLWTRCIHCVVSWQPADMQMLLVWYISFTGMCITVALLQSLVSLQALLTHDRASELIQTNCMCRMEGPRI